MSVNESIAGRRFSAERNQRIAVVGTTGSGKTALARRVSRQLDIPHVELDALYWGPHWAPAPTEVFRQRAAQALSGDAWVVDGNSTPTWRWCTCALRDPHTVG
jgi:adenylate kinase family enzyme